jgi:aconitate hydratase
MTRGTFGNIRVKNKLASESGKPREGWWTRDTSAGSSAPIEPIFDVAMRFKQASTPAVVLAGKDYGMGSSRDWAAKGTMLLGVRAVIAESFERIHRSNLVGMGVMPLVFPEGQTASSLGLTGFETFDIIVPDPLEPRSIVHVKATTPDGRVIEFDAMCRIDTPVEIEYYRHGGILQFVIRKKLNESMQPA